MATTRPIRAGHAGLIGPPLFLTIVFCFGLVMVQSHQIQSAQAGVSAAASAKRTLNGPSTGSSTSKLSPSASSTTASTPASTTTGTGSAPASRTSQSATGSGSLSSTTSNASKTGSTAPGASPQSSGTGGTGQALQSAIQNNAPAQKLLDKVVQPVQTTLQDVTSGLPKF